MIENKIKVIKLEMGVKEKKILNYEITNLKKNREVAVKIGNGFFILKENQKNDLTKN